MLIQKISRYVGAFAVILIAAANVLAEDFPVPDVIKHNVAFWIRIYTEVGLKEGLIHDTEHPQIIYEKVISGERTGKARSEYIDGRRKIYVNAVIAVQDSSQDKWGEVEKRVAELWKGAPEGALAGAEGRVRHQTGQRERFKAGLERSGMYLDTISAILKRHGVPDELKYLPHVESSFDAEAYSKVGAAGLWQFMRSTGRGYLKIDYMFDERRDGIKSTYAAAKFMRTNYDMLKKWPLAVTAYNHGPNGIRRAVASVGSDDIAVILQKHESPSFKFASKNFYSCFIAVLQIMEKPEKYFKNIKYKPKWEATAVQMPFAMKPAALLKAVGVSEQEFKTLNPSFRPVVFQQQKPIPAGYYVNLPVSIKADEALAALDRTPAPQRVTPREAAAAETEGYYTVVSGDNLNGIARRLGVSMADLAAINNITNQSKIYVGQVLSVPSGGITVASAAKPKRAETVSTPSSPKKDTVTIAASTHTDTVRTEVVHTEVVHTEVVRTDTVKTDTTVSSSTVQVASSKSKPAKTDTAKTSSKTKKAPEPILRKLNIYVSSQYDYSKHPAVIDDPQASTTKPVAPTTPKPDVKQAAADTSSTTEPALTPTLSAVAFKEAEPEPGTPTTPSGKPSADTRFDAAAYDFKMTAAPDSKSVRVRILVDETIAHFAEWMRVYTDDIRKLNDISASDRLMLGNTISIPIKNSPRERVKRFEAKRLEYHMAIEEDFFARYNVTDFDRRRVKSGDTPWRICAEAQIPMWLLQKYNRKTNIFRLKAGDYLWIPKIASKDGEHEVPVDFSPVITESDIND